MGQPVDLTGAVALLCSDTALKDGASNAVLPDRLRRNGSHPGVLGDRIVGGVRRVDPVQRVEPSSGGNDRVEIALIHRDGVDQLTDIWVQPARVADQHPGPQSGPDQHADHLPPNVPGGGGDGNLHQRSTHQRR